MNKRQIAELLLDWRWCRENGITLTTEIVEVKRERDLHKK